MACTDFNAGKMNPTVLQSIPTPTPDMKASAITKPTPSTKYSFGILVSICVQIKRYVVSE